MKRLRESGPEHSRKSARLTRDEARELATLLLDPKAAKEELLGLMYAWEGSIKHGPGRMASMSHDSLAKVLLILNDTCRLPEP